MIRAAVLVLALLATSAFAQDARPQPVPQTNSQASDRIAAQIGRMLIQIESDADKIRDLQAALMAKQKEVDDLRAKVEKK